MDEGQIVHKYVNEFKCMAICKTKQSDCILLSSMNMRICFQHINVIYISIYTVCDYRYQIDDWVNMFVCVCVH